MPKSTKDQLKRTMGQAVNNINLAATYLSTIEDTFRPVHPELADGLVAALGLLKSTTEVIDMFALNAWGMENPNWQAWKE